MVENGKVSFRVVLWKGVRFWAISCWVRASIRGWSCPHIISVDNLHAKEKVRVLVVALCYSMLLRWCKNRF